MSKILNYAFEQTYDNTGKPIINFWFDYNCDNERKRSSIFIPCKSITEEQRELFIAHAENHIDRRNAE